MNVVLVLCILVASCGIGYSQTAYSLVRAWGEPHIDSYVHTLHEMCGAPGWRVYLSNPFMDIYVYNWQGSLSSDWTVMTQVLVYMKDPTTGMPIAIYYVPDSPSSIHPGTLAFPGGTTASAPGFPSNHVVNLYTFGFYRVLTHSTARTAIVIGPKASRNTRIILSLNVYLPTWVAGISSGILIQGCPAGHVITTFPGRVRRDTSNVCEKYDRNIRRACEQDEMYLGKLFAEEAAEGVIGGDEQARRAIKELLQDDATTRPTLATRPTQRPTGRPFRRGSS